MPVRIIQSSDRGRYSRLLETSSRTVFEYCRRHDCEYELFIGIRRGAQPWHAALNRISVLRRFMDRGYTGWVLHLDADAYIADLDFDLHAYLADKAHVAMIAAPSGMPPHEWWNINNGVFLINLGHPGGREIVAAWHERLTAIPLDRLVAERHWGDAIDDQVVLHEVLAARGHLAGAMLVDRELLNWDNRFVRQIVRGQGSIELRRTLLEQAVNDVLGIDPDEAHHVSRSVQENHAAFARAIYGAVLMRSADALGFSTVVETLERGDRSYQEELQACFASPEFGGKLPEFVERYLSEDAARALTARLVARYGDQRVTAE